MRVAIGGIMHESNTFASTGTPLSAFGVLRGEEILAAYAEGFHEVAGFIQAGTELGFELVPTLFAGATPAGTVAAEAFETLVGELLERLRTAGPLDGMLLALHGAMAVDGFPDGDGEVVRRLREALGPRFPLVVSHDFHANISDRLVEHSTALVVYQTNPHVDQRQCGLRAGRLLGRILRAEVRPTQAVARPAMLLNIRYQNTSQEPLRPVMEAAAALEGEAGVLASSVAGGYQYADVFEVGPAAVVVTDNDPGRARDLAEGLSRRLWDLRERLVIDLPGPAAAVERALQGLKAAEGGSSEAPVVMVEMGDNIGGGSAGDSTSLLAELLRQGAAGWVVVLADPAAVAECARAGVGRPVSLSAGGKTDSLHGKPVAVRGRVRSLHEGTYADWQVRHGGQQRYNQGLTAVVEVARPENRAKPEPGVAAHAYLVLTSLREPPFSLQQIVSLGINPERQQILVVKAAIAYRAAYEPIAGRIIEVDTPGLTCINPASFTYTRARRPLWGLSASETAARG